MTPELFKKIASHWLTGVAVVTSTTADGEPCGMTMSAVTSLSLDPAQFLVCMDKKAKTLSAVAESRAFCIHFLRDTQQELSTHFARPGADRFAGIAYRLGQTGAPILTGTVAFVECELADILPGGDHSIVIGTAVCGDAEGGFPLGYYHGAYRKITN